MRNTLLQFDKLLQVQQRCLDTIEYDQARTVLNALRRSRVKQLLALVFSNIVTVYFALGHLSDLPLVIMAGLLVLFNAVGMAGNMWQLQVLQQQEHWKNLRGTQKKTGLLQTAALLQSLMIRSLRIRLLALPLYSLYVVIGFAFTGWRMDKELLVSMAALLLPVGIWLYCKVKYTNLHIKWVAGLVNGAGRKYLLELQGFSPSVSGT
ncbi:hypothetical protein [Chitinophaga niabensis]|uniref:Uncharacterized protein n=1 Tax=Chitinophaga niabensis TaxID=536979 RepID=A0A1N6K3V0_9BACT|nr:hypothetical protein [Chitinophaga niabensis]SIO51220.1 hypothetical protein SAMN04488055_5022 [Chitinophaga niabensis]